MPQMIKGDGYNYVPCVHNEDPLNCGRCELFKNGAAIEYKGSKLDILRHPIGYLRMRLSIKKIVKHG